MPIETYKNLLNNAEKEDCVASKPVTILKLFWDEYEATEEYQASINTSFLLTSIPSTKRLYYFLIANINTSKQHEPNFVLFSFYLQPEFLGMLSVFFNKFPELLPLLKSFGSLTSKIIIEPNTILNFKERANKYLQKLFHRLQKSINENALYRFSNLAFNIMERKQDLTDDQKKLLVKGFISIIKLNSEIKNLKKNQAILFDIIEDNYESCVAWADELIKDHVINEVTQLIKIAIKYHLKGRIIDRQSIIENWANSFEDATIILKNTIIKTLLDFIGDFSELEKPLWEIMLTNLNSISINFDEMQLHGVQKEIIQIEVKLRNKVKFPKEYYLLNLTILRLFLADLSLKKGYQSYDNIHEQTSVLISDLLKSFLTSSYYLKEKCVLAQLLYPKANEEIQEKIFNNMLSISSQHKNEMEVLAFFMEVFPFLNSKKQNFAINLVLNTTLDNEFYFLKIIYIKYMDWREYISAFLFNNKTHVVEALNTLTGLIPVFTDADLKKFKDTVYAYCELAVESDIKIKAQYIKENYFAEKLTFAKDHKKIVELFNEGHYKRIKDLSSFTLSEKLSIYYITNDYTAWKLMKDAVTNQEPLEEKIPTVMPACF